MQCPICGGEGEALGILGIREHLRCCNCGGMFSRVVQRCNGCNGVMGQDEDPGDGRCCECHAGSDQPDEPEVWSHNDICLSEMGGYVCHSSTNDNGDTGYPGEYSSWQTRWENLAACLHAVGVCRVGVVGHKTTTTFLGDDIVSVEQALRLDMDFRSAESTPGQRS